MEASRLRQIYTVTVFLAGGQFVFEFYFFFYRWEGSEDMSQALGWGPIFYLQSDLLYNINKISLFV